MLVSQSRLSSPRHFIGIAPFAFSLALVACSVTDGAPASPSKTLEGPARIGESVYVDGPIVMPLAVLEDSRCPQDVQCVWAGQVRLKVRVTTGSGARDMELINGKSVPVADGQLTLMTITPARSQNKAIAPKAYRFTFRFEGGL